MLLSYVSSFIIPHSSCHRIPSHTFSNPSVPLEHSHRFAAWIDGSVQSYLGLRVFIEHADSLWDESLARGEPHFYA